MTLVEGLLVAAGAEGLALGALLWYIHLLRQTLTARDTADAAAAALQVAENARIRASEAEADAALATEARDDEKAVTAAGADAGRAADLLHRGGPGGKPASRLPTPVGFALPGPTQPPK